MTKLALAAVVLLAFLALAQASSFRTFVTTTVEEENQGQWGGQSRQRCQQQVQQRWQQLQPCKQYLQQSSPFEMDMYMNQRQQEQQQLRRCCQQLQNFGEECSCEAVRQIVQEQLPQEQWGQGGQGQGQGQWGQGGQGQGQGQWGQGGQQGQRRVQQMLQKARNLPRQCNIGRECQIQSPYY